MTRPQRVEITWIDAYSTSGWGHAIPSEKMIWTSVGYLLAKTKQEVVICQSQDPWGKSGERLTIPRSCVKRIRRLR